MVEEFVLPAIGQMGAIPFDGGLSIAGEAIAIRTQGLGVIDAGEDSFFPKPFWIFEDVENPTRVERLVPLPPFSSENAKFKALKRSLAVYRLAFGQPRQEDLIEFLAEAADGADSRLLREMQLNLAP